VISPAFSPDGGSIAFFSGDATIKRIPVSGGTAITLGAFTNPFGLSWGPDGILVGQAARGILRVPSNGGPAEVVVAAKDDEVLYGPQVLPGGRAVLFSAARNLNGASMSVWDRAQISIQPLPSGERKVLFDGGSDARYVPSGHIVYAVGGVEFAVPFDLERLAITGAAAPILEGVARSSGGATGTTHLAVAANGTLAFVPGPVNLGAGGRELVVFDSKGGAAAPLPIPPANIQFPRVSPDGKRVAFNTEDEKEAVVWTYELAGTTAMRRITFGGKNRFPIWSADGQYLVFQSDREGDVGIFRQRADGSGTAERLTKAGKDAAHIPESWSPRDEGFLFRETRSAKSSLMFYSIKDRQASPFGGVVVGTPTDAVFSPDGRWVAYESGEMGGSGRSINVQPFPATGATYQLPTVEPGGYRHPRWSPDGRSLFYIIGGSIRLMVVGVSTQPTFAFGNPARLQKHGSWIDNFNDAATHWDVLPDGQHFIARAVTGAVAQANGEAPQRQQIQVVLNWFEELKQRVPTK
jgi:serine/threonine-protein kinase